MQVYSILPKGDENIALSLPRVNLVGPTGPASGCQREAVATISCSSLDMLQYAADADWVCGTRSSFASILHFATRVNRCSTTRFVPRLRWRYSSTSQTHEALPPLRVVLMFTCSRLTPTRLSSYSKNNSITTDQLVSASLDPIAHGMPLPDSLCQLSRGTATHQPLV